MVAIVVPLDGQHIVQWQHHQVSRSGLSSHLWRLVAVWRYDTDILHHLRAEARSTNGGLVVQMMAIRGNCCCYSAITALFLVKCSFHIDSELFLCVLYEEVHNPRGTNRILTSNVRRSWRVSIVCSSTMTASVVVRRLPRLMVGVIATTTRWFSNNFCFQLIAWAHFRDALVAFQWKLFCLIRVLLVDWKILNWNVASASVVWLQ